MVPTPLKWDTGSWTSYPDDGRAILERDDAGWWVFDGDTAEWVPMHADPFPTVEDAQRWVEAVVAPRKS